MLSIEEREKLLFANNTAKDRVAVCFSGQIRTWRKCADNWHYILNSLGYSSDRVDVFCHIWDYNTTPNSITLDGEPVKVNSQEVSEILARLKPKKFLIESKKDFKPYSNNQPIRNSGFLSQFYSIMRCANLKREFEIENDMRYSAVARSRYDTLYSDNLAGLFHNIKPRSVKTCGLLWDKENNRGRISDLFWVSDSDTYDIIADYYINLGIIDERLLKKHGETLYPECAFFYYLKKNDIVIQPNNSWIIKVMRESMELSHTKREGDYEVW